ncbi:hypothetical protein BH23VER1_BH23VER1_01710 [soil metagenome]
MEKQEGELEGRWGELRSKLIKKSRHEESQGGHWDEDEIPRILSEANLKGISPELVFECRDACASHEEFMIRMREMVGSAENRKKRVLAVDDEEDFLTLVKMNLERTGRYEVKTLTDPTRALAEAGEFHPDLFLLDVVMPGIDGMELLQQLRESPQLRKTPVIMLTALAHSVKGGGVTSEGLLYLAKPVRMKELIHCIEEHTRAMGAH